MTTFVGIKLLKREENSQKFQKVLSKYGCYIKTRIGLHEVQDDICSQDGIIILEVLGSGELITGMLYELNSIGGINFDSMTL